MGGEWNFIHSPPIFRAQSCLTDAVIVIFPDYCFTDTHLNRCPDFSRPAQSGSRKGKNAPYGQDGFDLPNEFYQIRSKGDQ